MATLLPLSASGQSDPRAVLAQSLLTGGLGAQPQNTGQGINSAAQAIIGALLAKRIGTEQQESREAGRAALLGALDTPGAAGSGDPLQRMTIANLLTDPNVMGTPGAGPVINMLLQGLQGPEPTSQIRNFQFAQDNPAFGDFLETTSSAPSATVNVGPGAFAPTRTTQNRLQGDTLDSQAALSRIDDIATSFNPEFLEIPTKIGMAFSSFRDKLGSVTDIFGIPDLTVEQKQSLADYTTFTTRTLRNLNITLNQLSGAAVNEQEFERIKGALPSTDDSPTEFQAKMVDATRDMRRSLARLNIAQARGLNPLDPGIPLDGVDAIINAEGARLRQGLQGSGLSAEEIDAAVAQDLQRTFFGGVF